MNRVNELQTLYGNAKTSVAFQLCDQYDADRVAFTVVAEDLSPTVLTFGQLRESSEKFAAALADLGIKPGDRVATLMGKSVEFLVALLGIWRLGAVHVPLFTAFAPPAIVMRLVGSNTKVVICDSNQRSKLMPGVDMPPDTPWRVVVVDSNETSAESLDKVDLSFRELLATHAAGMSAVSLGGSAPMVHIYTSGTTGAPKGVVVPTAALAAFRMYMEYALDVQADDIFWCAADPGWAYGLYYGIIGALSVGVSSVLLRGGFSPQSTLQTMSRYRVTNFAAAPTVYRALHASKEPMPGQLWLKKASSAGEPLTPDVNAWMDSAMGVLVHDHYGQTEGGMLVNNHHHSDLHRPLVNGSMGHAMPGWTVQVLFDDRDEVAPAGTVGRIAIDVLKSPLAWFSGYENEPTRTAEKFTANKRWYLTGDKGKVDEAGYFHFSARDDDVIIMAGYRIGPFEVESVLATHPAVVESAVIAVPDEIRGEVMEAYVALRDPSEASPALEIELQQLVKTKFAAHAYPRRVHFVSELPKTPSSKIQRFVLRQRRRDELST